MMKTEEQKHLLEQARFRRTLRALSPEEQVHAKALRQQQRYAAEYYDHGHRSAVYEFSRDWKHAFKVDCPPDQLERFAKARLEIYGAAKCGTCGCRSSWLEDDTKEELSKECYPRDCWMR